MRIRRGRPADLDAVREVFRRASLSNAGDRDALLAHPEALVLSGESLGEGRTWVAVTDDGTVAGFATILVAEGVAELEDLFVDPTRMRQGVATGLVRSVLAEARSQEFGRVEVTANQHASAFYASVGFVAAGVARTRFGPAPRLRLDLADKPTD